MGVYSRTILGMAIKKIANKRPTNKSDSCVGAVVLTTRYGGKTHKEAGRANAKASKLYSTVYFVK